MSAKVGFCRARVAFSFFILCIHMIPHFEPRRQMVPEHIYELTLVSFGRIIGNFWLQPIQFGQNRGFSSCSFRPF
ncbi:uncharacterized protein M6B38_391200 [Iris pallida]|uniref:Secreted protein n=1 Tax=Iris pallida TaxID=29817 RepID=A0AAX6FYY7_IRIPA|nr:uncharacterized protein M6B38_391200 [Iris pallida]